MYDLISIGNITIDLFFKGDSLTQKDDRFFLALGGKYSASYFHESLGGGGANVAVGCASFGLNCAVIGSIGENPFKNVIIQKLVKKGISCEFLRVEKNYINISAILLNEKGERTVVHYGTPHTDNITLNYLLPHSPKSKMIYMGNIRGITLNERKKSLCLFKKNSSLICIGLGISDCRNGFSYLKDILSCVDILILNTHEFSELVKKKYSNINFNENQAGLIHFDNQIVVLTDAEKGAYAYYKKKVYYQNAPTIKKIVDTTGAGDAFTSGFLSSYATDKNIQKALIRGSEYASSILSKIGAQ
ncbi:MAG TPA: carbohydrate kinase family protein [Patescibacteria group bacterium]|nr:carbohydrate kinase family protein [Patescibacteria group bacterium]